MDRIRELRNLKGVSQAKLAVTAGMDPATLNRIEQGKGNPNLKTLEKLANALGVGIVDLLEPEAGKAGAPPSSEPEKVSEEQRRALDYARPWVFLLGRVAERLEGLSRGGFDAGAFVEAEDDVREIMSALNIFMRELEERGVDPMAGPVGSALRDPMLRLSSAMQASAIAIIHGLSEDELAQARRRRAERRTATENPTQEAAN
ncbi:MAG: helix-turn-helix domain-containing protein [Actinomycetota bacterium]|nr:helix-turn-helix domain-containing protein [Actinomycetota bacterium]